MLQKNIFDFHPLTWIESVNNIWEGKQYDQLPIGEVGEHTENIQAFCASNFKVLYMW